MLAKAEAAAEILGKRQERFGKVWMFAYECAGIAQAGGLGEAVGGLAKTLASDYGLKITVFLPSHGRHLDEKIVDDYGFKEISTFIADGYRIGTNSLRYGFLSGVERGVRDNVEYILVKGLDSSTEHWLDNPVLYNHDVTYEKMALFARTVKAYSEYLISTQQEALLPDVIHAHDWHMVPGGVAVKQHLRERGLVVPLVFTVHLLSHVSLPWHYASEDWCGIRGTPQKIILGDRRLSRATYRQVWEEYSHDSLERFGCYEADYVSSVSRSYLANDVSSYVGEVINRKSGHIYNGCDWEYDTIKTEVLTKYREETAWPKETTVERWDLRKYLLTSAIGQAGLEGAIEDDDAFSNGQLYDSNMILEPFKSDGPLVLMTGRLTPQKGPDLLLDAVPRVKRVVPNVRFLLFLLPPNGSGLESTLQTKATGLRDNVRLIFSKHPSLYMLSHIAADAYAMPSRSEPFGISALEAMATGNPVVGTETGGIGETILDVSTYREKGTGLLFSPEDVKEMADSLASILLAMRIDERSRRHEDLPEDVERIPLQFLRKIVTKDPRFGSRLRANCISRVERDFRWRNAGQMALDRYATAGKLARQGR